MHKSSHAPIALAIAASLFVSSCATYTGQTNAPDDPNRTQRGALIGAAVGGAAGAIRGSNQDRNNQQRYRDSQGRYYYCYDNRQSECYWENGQRRY